ncbi:uncharacterized protein LOC122857681 isoform X2 [Aphidius gifuensis]|uniref:uncharacterized protein LOC122857681 isoform X2 n=1 Tax=Aphidius gifuensis TaxID=684658 RepID=UPI001CDCDC49|nr:uncharacterized protein LOC122857681 isoform X2 [Aphidius gifuensis]XP_044015906.1 uncharacterized protein LOC122857681 isoform X2 [Aphidius gifuensis]
MHVVKIWSRQCTFHGKLGGFIKDPEDEFPTAFEVGVYGGPSETLEVYLPNLNVNFTIDECHVIPPNLMRPISIPKNFSEDQNKIDIEAMRYLAIEIDNNTCSFQIDPIVDEDYGKWIIIYTFKKVYNEFQMVIGYQPPLIGVLHIYC